jgi:hypothetical protein
VETNKPATLCWKCANACGKCSWSDGTFTPVDGWTAVKTILHIAPKNERWGRDTESYHVTACPLFEDDTKQYNNPVKRNKWNSAPYLQEVIR